MQFVEAEVEIAAMTPQKREEARRKAKLLEMLQKLRITPDMDLPPLEFLFNMLGKPCFPRGEVVTVTGKPKSGKTFFLSLLMTACTSDTLLLLLHSRNNPTRNIFLYVHSHIVHYYLDVILYHESLYL